MIRVCGITFSHSPNYGSCLQTYALQEAIESLRISGEACSYQVIPVQMLRDYPANNLSARLMKPLLAWNRLRYQSFYRKYMKYAACKSISNLPDLNREYDAFVCGSDVIWNDSFSRLIGAYYLDFAEKYRFSYAASFGKDHVSDAYIQKTKKKIDRLNAVSVREASGVRIAMRCTQKPVRIVADPVLLVDRTKWNEIAARHKADDPYIFVYATHLNDTIEAYVSKLQKLTGRRVIWAVAGPKQAMKKGIVFVQTPEEWLGLLRDAEYVITNSFHATAFSALFHKIFFTVVQGEKDAGINVRMNDFLHMIGLEDRIFSTVPQTIDLKEIDYSGADQKIHAFKEQSLAFLRENLEAAYREKQQAESKEACPHGTKMAEQH